MTAYYGFKPSESLHQQINTLLNNLDSGVSAPQHQLHTQISILMADEILDNMLMSLVNAMKGEGEGAGILGTLASLIKGTVHVLIKQLLGKHDNAEVNKMAQYLRDRKLVLNGEERFGFELPAALGAELLALFAKARAGEGRAHKAELNAAMLKFVDIAMERFYDDFAAPMDLGFIKRKAVDIGRSTMVKGSHSAINKLIPSLGEDQMKAFGEIYGSQFVEA